MCNPTFSTFLIGLTFVTLNQPGLACRAPIDYCQKYAARCASGSQAYFCFSTTGCGKKCGTACELSDGPYCKGAPDLEKSSGSTQKCLNLKRWRKSALKRTNELRVRHGAPRLVENQELNEVAQAYAEKLQKYNLWKHSSNGYGENLARASGSVNGHAWVNYIQHAYHAEDPIDAWYQEINDWDFAKNKAKNNKQIGHFTQLIWNASTEVGHGFATDSQCSMILSVANYLPGGNIQGAYAANVARLRQPLSNYCEAQRSWCLNTGRSLQKLPKFKSLSSQQLDHETQSFDNNKICNHLWRTVDCGSKCGTIGDTYAKYCSPHASGGQSSFWIRGHFMSITVVAIMYLHIPFEVLLHP